MTACLLAAVGCSHPKETSSAARIQNWLYSGQLDSLRVYASPELKAHFKEQGGLERFYTQVIERLAPESEEVSYQEFHQGSVTHVVRTVRFSQDPERLRNLWIGFTPDGTIHKLSLRLAEDALCLSQARPRICLRLPFEGAWTVLHGGPLREQNIYAVDPLQCYGVEWHQTKDDRSYRGSGHANTDYYGYGQEVLAPASGVVVALENQVVENVPGVPNYNSPWGNHLILDHHTGEFSVLGSLQPGSIRARLGDTVVAGEVVGLCGNSGLSREPKLHMHLQSAPGGGEGKPMGFTQLRVNGNRTAYAALMTGQQTRSLWVGSTAGAQQ